MTSYYISSAEYKGNIKTNVKTRIIIKTRPFYDKKKGMICLLGPLGITNDHYEHYAHGTFYSEEEAYIFIQKMWPSACKADYYTALYAHDRFWVAEFVVAQKPFS